MAETLGMEHARVAQELLSATPLVTRRALAQAGLGPDAVAGLVRRGLVEQVTLGVYAAPDPDLTNVGRLLRLSRAVAMRLEGRVVVSHHGALAAYGLPLVGVDTGRAHLTYRAGGSHRTRRDHVLHPAGIVGPDSLTVEDVIGLPVALVQVGMTWGQRPFIVAADAALRERLATREQLARAAHAHRYAKGHSHVRVTLPLVDERSESPGESILRLVLIRLGYSVTPQYEILARGRRCRADLRLDGTNVVIEFDGMGKYDGPDAFRAEKMREEALRVEGWIVVRFVWRDLWNPAEIRRRVEWALAVDAGRSANAAAGRRLG